MNGLAVPSTPYSMALENFKWLNVYSKQENTRRVDELMAKINKNYKAEILEDIVNVSRDVYYVNKKKPESNSSNGPFSNSANS